MLHLLIRVFSLTVGTSLLVSTHTDVDKTGQSYYGETSLYFIDVKNELNMSVALGETMLLGRLETLPYVRAGVADTMVWPISCRQRWSHLRCGLEPQWPRVCCGLWIYACKG